MNLVAEANVAASQMSVWTDDFIFLTEGGDRTTEPERIGDAMEELI